MAKDAYYFAHDYSARNDPKLQKLQMKLGHAGKGIFWDLVEILYEQGGLIPMHECDCIAFALRTDCDTLTAVLRDFDLFQNDGKNYFSLSVLKRLERRNEKSSKASESARKRWADANALRTQCERYAKKGKERKGKHILSRVVDKNEKTPPPPPKPPPPEKKTPPTLQMVTDQLNLMQPTPPTDQAQKFHDYYQSNGWRVGRNPMKDWKAALRNWIKRSKDFETSKKTNGQYEPEQKYKTESDPFAVYKPY